MSNLVSKYRSQLCNELRKEHAGQRVTLSGWVSRKRDHGGVIFIDLRDHYGVTQVVLHGDLGAQADQLRIESVIQVAGEVTVRGEGLANPKLPTGEVEVQADEMEVHSAAEVLPFLVVEDDNAPEAIRLESRFLELRREKLHNNILVRSKVNSAIRRIMEKEGFTEFQTPILTSSSPEGARDFIVPSRLHPGKFYALPQAPQQFKQLLMVAGFDRYFQIAPCFRDEDSRADRSPGEFYQLDMELSFVEQDDVFVLNERVMTTLMSEFSDYPITGRGEDGRFNQIPYYESMARFGTDKPDLRNPLEISEVSEVFSKTDFRVFQNLLAGGGQIFSIAVKDVDAPARKYFDGLIKEFTDTTGLGLGYLAFDGEEYKGSFKKLLRPDEVADLRARLGLEAKGLVFIAGGNPKELLPHLGKLRTKIGWDMELVDEKSWAFCWITDFPFYEFDEEKGQLDFGHNPFSMPSGGLEALRNEDPESIKANQYDMVLNGYELASGAIRNHSAEIMYEAFAKVGYDAAVVEEKFGALLKAFKYGVPPHGGIAFGIDRIVMLLCGEEAIRDVMAFPLAQNGEDLLMGAPSTVFDQQLKDTHIQLNLPEEVEV